MVEGADSDQPSDSDPSDSELLRQHGAGDPDAFAELVRRHRDRLWAVALRTLGDREEAADAVQDALVSAFRASAGSSARTGAGSAAGSTPGGPAAAFRGEAAVTTWLHRIVVNACIDRSRRRAVRPTDPLPERELADPRPDAHSARETSLDVTAALAHLPPEQRAALVLVDMYGWSVADAAVVLGCPPGTVKSRCSRGRARLVPLLRDVVPGGDVAAHPRNPEPAGRVPPLEFTSTDPVDPRGIDPRGIDPRGIDPRSPGPHAPTEGGDPPP